MALQDLLNALRGRRPAGGGDGACRKPSGEPLDLELYTFDT
jgi:hypothetical protein